MRNLWSASSESHYRRSWLFAAAALSVLLIGFGTGWVVAGMRADERDAALVETEQAQSNEEAAKDYLETACQSGIRSACDMLKGIESQPDPDDPEAQDAEIQDSELQEPEIQESERQEAERQDPEIQDPDRNDPEAQDDETQDPETDDPETDDPETQDSEVDDPDKDDPEIQEPEIQDDETQDPEIQDDEVQDPEVDDPDPNDLPTCPDGSEPRQYTVLTTDGPQAIYACPVG